MNAGLAVVVWGCSDIRCGLPIFTERSFHFGYLRVCEWKRVALTPERDFAANYALQSIANTPGSGRLG